MSRSYKKLPITGHSLAESEQHDKRLANRRLRRAVRQVMCSLIGDEDEVALPEMRDVSNVATFDKDGKQYLDEPEPKDWRK